MKEIRFIPYGYTIRDGRTIIDHNEADIIKEIFKDYIRGASLKEIAEDLTERRIPYTEKTDVWDKARIARIIDNARYLGTDEYDPIIDEDTYESAVSAKTARQRNVIKNECEGIALLRNRVKCAECGADMVRRLSSRRKINESWKCTNEECSCKIRISDSDLLIKVTVLMNRIIENANLIIPKTKTKPTVSMTVASYQNDMDAELNKPMPSESLIISKISDMASQMYKESNSKEMIAAHIAKKRITYMKPQKNFNCTYFSDLVSYITLDTSGRVILHTKTETQIGEGDEQNGCN